MHIDKKRTSLIGFCHNTKEEKQGRMLMTNKKAVDVDECMFLTYPGSSCNNVSRIISAKLTALSLR